MMSLKKIYWWLYNRLSPRVPGYMEAIMSVDGQVSYRECRLLYKLASRASGGCIVELGSYRGRTTVALALGSLAGNRLPVYAIEPHEPFTGARGGNYGPRDREEFYKNMLRIGVSEVVRLVNLDSHLAAAGWDKDIALLWLDANHEYDAVKRDFQLWGRFVIAGGLVAFHDSADPASGPAKVVAEALASGRFRRVRRVNLLTVLRKL